jgi:hypothetical protein
LPLVAGRLGGLETLLGMLDREGVELGRLLLEDRLELLEPEE